METETTQSATNFMTSDYGDNKISKQNELNSNMSITNTGNDELTQKLKGGIN